MYSPCDDVPVTRVEIHSTSAEQLVPGTSLGLLLLIILTNNNSKIGLRVQVTDVSK